MFKTPISFYHNFVFYFVLFYFILFIGHTNIRNNVIYSFPYFWSIFVYWKVGSVKKNFVGFVLHFISNAQNMPGTVST